MILICDIEHPFMTVNISPFKIAQSHESDEYSPTKAILYSL